jgi:Glycosyltransferase family 87
MTTRGGMVLWCCVALVLVRVAVVGIALGQDATDGGRQRVLPGDVRRYHRIASLRGTPYADFAVEYPPITLAAIDALDGRTVRDATVHVMWSQVALDAVVALLLAWGWGRRAALMYLLLGLAFLWYPFLYLRLDLLSVVLAVGGLALARRRALTAGGAMVGIACFAKIWPLALAPMFAARRTWRALGAFLAVALAGMAAWIAWAGTNGPVQVLTFRGAPGWQIESTVGAVVHVFAHANARMEQGAARIGVVPDWARLGLPALALGGVAGIWWLVRRRPSAPVHVVDGVAPVAAVSALLVGATLLSPQYVSWLLPFAAIAAAGGDRLIGWMTALVAGLSTLDLNLVKEVNSGLPLPMAVVVLRNALLLALLVVAVVRIVRLAREPSVAPARVATPVREPALVPVRVT